LNRIQPELGETIAVLNMDVRRFRSLEIVEEEAEA
jgi:hypothetical protein